MGANNLLEHDRDADDDGPSFKVVAQGTLPFGGSLIVQIKVSQPRFRQQSVGLLVGNQARPIAD